jgi:hypothetical protein
VQFWLGALIAILLAFFAGRRITQIHNVKARRFSLIVLCSILPFLWFAMGAKDGCYLWHSEGEKCFGFGFGLVLLSPVMALFAVSSVMGYFLSFRKVK